VYAVYACEWKGILMVIALLNLWEISYSIYDCSSEKVVYTFKKISTV
jgi:hypothetical protein